MSEHSGSIISSPSSGTVDFYEWEVTNKATGEKLTVREEGHVEFKRHGCNTVGCGEWSDPLVIYLPEPSDYLVIPVLLIALAGLYRWRYVKKSS